MSYSGFRTPLSTSFLSHLYLKWIPNLSQALVRCAEDVIHTLAETVLFDGQRDHWVLDLERLKEKLYSAVQLIVQTLRAVSRYHHNYNKAMHAWPPPLLQLCPQGNTDFDYFPHRPALGTVWSSTRTSSRSCCLVLMEALVPHKLRGGTGEWFLHGDTESLLSWGKTRLLIQRSWFIWLICLVSSQMMKSSRRARRCPSGESVDSHDM